VVRHEERRKPIALPYYQAATFANGKTSGAVYDRLQHLIHTEECDLSVFRFKRKTTWYVVAIGEKPQDSIHIEIESQLTNGNLTKLETEVLSYLIDRRQQASQVAPWVEVHYQPPDE
jgi:hypothetical protein